MLDTRSTEEFKEPIVEATELDTQLIFRQLRNTMRAATIPTAGELVTRIAGEAETVLRRNPALISDPVVVS